MPDAVHPFSGPIPVTRVDGNALAGPLSEVFATDMTLATGECRNCTLLMPLADTIVEMDDAGFIVLCPGCGHTLFTVVHTAKRTWVDLQGISGLGIPRD